MNKNVLTSTNLIAKCTYNNGCNAAFLEVRNDLELWVYGQINGKSAVRGPEVKIDLKLSAQAKEELLLRTSWVDPMSQSVRNSVLKAWKLAAQQHPFFKNLVMCMN